MQIGQNRDLPYKKYNSIEKELFMIIGKNICTSLQAGNWVKTLGPKSIPLPKLKPLMCHRWIGKSDLKNGQYTSHYPGSLTPPGL